MGNNPELRFPKFTRQWKNYNLGEILTIKSASRVHKNQWTESGVPFFRSSDVVASYKGLDNKKAYISLELFRELSDKSGCVKKDDLLITGGGSIGIPYLIKTNEPLYFKDADLLWLKNSDQINGYFLYTFFITMLFRKHLARINHTGTISHYTIEQAKSTPIKLPEINEQQKIAYFLSSVDNKIILLTEKQSLLQRYKKGVMQKLFLQELRFKDDKGNDFPDWEKTNIGEISDVKGGKRIPKGFSLQMENNGIPYITVSDMSRNSVSTVKIKYVPIEAADKIRNYKISTHDIYISVAGTLGLVGIIPDSLNNANLTENANKLTNLKCNQRFLLEYLKSDNFKRLIDSVKTDNAQPKLAIYAIKAFKINLPDKKEQLKIADFLSKLDEKIESVTHQIEQATIFKKGLLQKMFV